MAEENSNSTEKKFVEVNTDVLDEAIILLERAHGILDLMYTLENSNDSTQGLCGGSLSAALDAAMVAVSRVNELLVSR